jgi:HPt (histidine-containing phosphotransfer) domain-containing protein
MDDYLSKPLRGEDIQAVLARHLPPDPSSALVDEARVRAFRDGHPEVAVRLAELFSETTPPLLAELREAVARGDREAVRRGAHKLKGSCQNIGATFMATLCRSLESGEGDAATLGELDEAFGATEAAVRSLLAG